MKTRIAAVAACLAVAGLCACERGDQAPRNIGGGPPAQESEAYASRTEAEPVRPDRGVMRLENMGKGTGPASAPYAHATASDPTGAVHVYGDKNCDTFRLREEAPTAIGGGPRSEGAMRVSTQNEGAHDGGK